MKFDQLIKSSKKNQKRVGRGIAAGGGKTAGRGTKGQGARKSGGVRPGFEGGQMPLYMRIPKLRGFTSHRVKAVNVYTGQLNSLSKTNVDNFTLAEAGIIENPYVTVKVVVNGDLKKKLAVNLQRASKEAVKQIEASGGKFNKIDKPQRKSTKSK